MSIVFALEDLDDETKIDIRKSLTFEGEISYIASQFNSDPKQIKFFNVKDGNVYLPHFTGLSLKEDVDFGNYPEKTEFSTTTPLRSLQEEVIEEAIPVLMETKSISIIMPTGTGKTRTATEIISRLPGKAVILYSLLSLGASWMGNFQKHTDCKSVCLLDKRTTLDNWVEKYNDFPDITQYHEFFFYLENNSVTIKARPRNSSGDYVHIQNFIVRDRENATIVPKLETDNY